MLVRKTTERGGPVPIIEVKHLHKRYRDTVAVEDVSFTVERGEIFGIVGPNGAGKTTTVETIEGLRTPDRGTVRVLGLDPWRDRAELRQRVGVQLQQSDLYDRLREGEALELFASFYRDPADLDRLLEELGLAGKRDTSFDKLSGDQRQRLSIALALVTRMAERGVTAKVLVLTTYETDRDVLSAIKAGATGYLLKDATRQELFRAVGAAARASR
jgi:ABC-type multidrug transport system ATPase subunit